jgi:hypothetical protein
MWSMHAQSGETLLKSTLPFATTRNWLRPNQEILKDKIFVNRPLGENGKS